MNRNLAVLKNGTDLAGELLLAVPATPQTDATALHWGNPINPATMGANRTFRPYDGL
jgi:hypothetical protein